MHANLSCDFCSSFAPILAEQTYGKTLLLKISVVSWCAEP